ncbi:unnamed protein product [Allacma fusca]|uniref:Uncharacterized protein n=1 Tax=Allacma fusca TaxID=39272 RepID=A0A8J2NVM5_9HEXA|nr:unnamed protein product [Allacma fusca]
MQQFQSTPERLTTVTLKEFVREHYQKLYYYTCNPEVFGRELLRLKILKDENQLDQCMNPSGTYGKNNEFYKRIIEADDCEGYINALQATENLGILKFLKEKLLPNNPINELPRPITLNPTIPLIPGIPLPPTTNPYTPSTELGKLLATKLKNVVNDLDRRNQHKGIPLKEVFQGYFTDLYVNTNIPDGLVTLLKDMKVLDDGSARKIMVTKDTEHTRCCDLIYGHLFKNRDVDLLIHMWEKTTNAHLIRWTQTWLDEKFP